MTLADEVIELRNLLGETIPIGGTEEDTLFTDEQLTKWVTSEDNLELAAVRGWKAKVAHFANLVTVTDGASTRQMSDLMDHAERMVKMYTKDSTPTAGRTRVGRIVRRDR